MAITHEIRVPNIGDFKNVPIVELLVKVGDVVRVEDPLVAIESEKATMEVPSPLEQSQAQAKPQNYHLPKLRLVSH